MDPERRQGKPEEELFMRPERSTDNESITIGPLRINKQASSPPPQASNRAPYNSRSPPNIYTQPYRAPTSDAPSRPLPYPDDPPYQHSSYGYRNHQGGLQYSQSPNTPQIRGEPTLPNLASPPRSTYPSRSRQEPDSTPEINKQNERRSHSQKPLPESPGPDLPDKEGLYYEEPQRGDTSRQRFNPVDSIAEVSEPASAATEFAHQYYPPPASLQANTHIPSSNLNVPNSANINRLVSSASVSTTKASRGSPPPPETPEGTYVGGNMYSPYPAAGIAGLAASHFQATPSTSASDLSRRPSFGPTNEEQSIGSDYYRRAQPEASNHPQNTDYRQSDHQAQAGLPSTAYQPNTAHPTPSPGPNTRLVGSPQPVRSGSVEHEFQRMRLGDEPPPAYTTVTGPRQDYPNEKPSMAGNYQQTPAQSGMVPDLHNHPAFANDPPYAVERPVNVASPTPSQAPTLAETSASQPHPTPSPGPNRTTPPPLPEGWIAHMDPASGHYYYIHLATQATQWEFPKGPTPSSLNEPLSPTGTYAASVATPTASTYNFNGGPLSSPGFPPQDPYRQSILSMSNLSTISTPTAAGFSQLPPTSGVEQYRVSPQNGVYFGPYLRYTNMDVDNGVWYGSIMLITDVPHSPTIHIHQSSDFSPNPRQLKPNPIYQHQRWSFYRYDVDLKMEEDHDAKWTYAITSHLGCTRYEFVVASRYETSWRFIAHSGNDFAMNVGSNERTKLGGEGYMWRDILQKHQDVGGFHAQIGMGNQIYADRLWKEIPSLRQWTAMSGRDQKKNTPWTTQLEDEVAHAYFHFYTSHLDQTPLREAFAQIPHVLTLDDHEIFDGYGSYPDHLQQSNFFRNIGRIGIQMYLLFQHHTTPSILQNTHNDFDIFTVTGTGWHFVKYLGPAVAVIGPDCRSERTQQQVMAGPTYQGLFPKVALLPPAVQHCIWLIPVPVIYPRLDTADSLAQTMATGKKAVTGTFNALGKVTSSVAGIVGAKSVVGEGFNSVKKAVGKSGLMSSVLSPFGELDILDELRDQWTHESKDIERTYLIRTLQGIAQQKSLRMTFFSGATNCCGVGLVHDPGVPLGHKTMYQVVSSSVVNAPPAPYVLKMLHPSGNGARPLYVPQNGRRSVVGQVSDTKEDMLEIFGQDVNGSVREGNKRLMGRRNYVAIVAFDAEAVKEGFSTSGSSYAGSTYAGSSYGRSSHHGSDNGQGYGQQAIQSGGRRPLGRLSLAVDFMVQGEFMGAFTPHGHGNGSGTVKYGPVIVPAVEYGR